MADNQVHNGIVTRESNARAWIYGTRKPILSVTSIRLILTKTLTDEQLPNSCFGYFTIDYTNLHFERLQGPVLNHFDIGRRNTEDEIIYFEKFFEITFSQILMNSEYMMVASRELPEIGTFTDDRWEKLSNTIRRMIEAFVYVIDRPDTREQLAEYEDLLFARQRQRTCLQNLVYENLYDISNFE